MLTSPVVINEPTKASLTVATMALLSLWLAHLNNKSNVCKHMPSLFTVHKQFVWYLILPTTDFAFIVDNQVVTHEVDI